MLTYELVGITVDLAAISPLLTGTVRVRDVWEHTDLPVVKDSSVYVTDALQPHDCAYVVFDAGAVV